MKVIHKDKQAVWKVIAFYKLLLLFRRWISNIYSVISGAFEVIILLLHGIFKKPLVIKLQKECISLLGNIKAP